MSTALAPVRSDSGRRRDIRVPDLGALPDNALLTDKQKSLHSGFSIEAFRKWRREGKGPETVYIEGRPRSTVAAYRAWLAGAARASA